MINDKQINFKSLSKDMISEMIQKSFWKQIFKNSNVLAPQSKNNLNNQLSLNSSSLELNTINNHQILVMEIMEVRLVPIKPWC